MMEPCSTPEYTGRDGEGGAIYHYMLCTIQKVGVKQV